MHEYRDRLLILLIAATLLIAIPVGYASGIVEAQAESATEPVLLLALGVLFLVVLVGTWLAFIRTDQ